MICVSEGDAGRHSYFPVLSTASTIHDSIFSVMSRPVNNKRSGFCKTDVCFPGKMIASFVLEGLAAEIWLRNLIYFESSTYFRLTVGKRN